MKTYQDLKVLGDNIELKTRFLIQAINEHKASEDYKTASDAELYAKQLNPTIVNYKKLLYTLSGQSVPDNYSANHKCASNFFSRFITQECQYLLGNGVTFGEESTKDKLGGTMFDFQLQRAGKMALIAGVAFGFFNLNKVEIFKLTEFVPLWDEENGALRAGIRFWQIDDNKPLRITLYEEDGYTDFIRRNNAALEVVKEKRPYKQIVVSSKADGTEIYDGGNYPSFPIVPLWGNPDHQSELVGIKGQIDAYDLIKSGFANDLDDASMIYWTIENAGGMDDIDLVKFLEHMKTVRAAVVDGDGGARAEAHTLDIPYQSRETYLTRLENDLYNDAMALNVHYIAAGNITATAINAAYEPLNEKTDQFEYCVIEFIKSILELAGIDDEPTFKRSKIANMSEETQMVLSAAQYLDGKTVLKHLPFLSPDEIDDIVDAMNDEAAAQYDMSQQPDMANIEGTDEE